MQNSKVVNAATDAGISSSSLIGGFIWITRLEDVAASATSSTKTTTSSSITATLEGFSITVLLPVEHTSFDAKRDQSITNLSWKTASELNNSHFEIERSTNGVDFKTIGSVTGNGTSNELNSYTFQNQNSISTAYCRLKQLDFEVGIRV
ncbi:hypothetical protein N9I68_02465 [Bacteroidia bacterium]|nr:hypothetical protein [Bacteroidia bacterium]